MGRKGPPTLVLHIGMPKAGSSSLQRFLFKNRQKLLRRGFCYPNVAADAVARRQHESVLRDIEQGNLEPATALVRRGFEEARHVVLSAERFGQALHRKQEQVTAFVETFVRAGHPVRAIAYVRRQDLYAQSAYRAAVRNPQGNRSLTFREFVEEKIAKFDYVTRFAPWAELLGKGNLRIRPFEQQQWQGGALTTDFLSLIGIENVSRFEAANNRSNPSLSPIVTELLRRTNARRNHEQHRELLSLLKDALPRAVLFEGSRGHAYFSPKEQHDFMARFAESNRRVATEWVGRQDGLLFEEAIDSTAPSAVADLSDDAVSELVNRIRTWLKDESNGNRHGPDALKRLGVE